jgi:hypothetical protein
MYWFLQALVFGWFVLLVMQTFQSSWVASLMDAAVPTAVSRNPHWLAQNQWDG